jgi:glycosyltransferase involved in cell wall biosynthesis
MDHGLRYGRQAWPFPGPLGPTKRPKDPCLFRDQAIAHSRNRARARREPFGPRLPSLCPGQQGRGSAGGMREGRTSAKARIEFQEEGAVGGDERVAVGRAIVSTQVAGCGEAVEERVNGFLVPARDAEALERAMRRFLDDPSLAIRMGPESRRITERDFDVHRVNEHMIHALGL